MSSLDTTLASIRDIEGWLTEAQATELWNSVKATEATTGSPVEIGSYRGKSTVVIANALASDQQLTAIDPHAGSDRGPGEIAPNQPLGDTDFAAFNSNLEAAGVSQRVNHVRLYSSQALESAPEQISFLYIDGAHRYGPARQDIKQWSERVSEEGLVLIHDAFCSVGVTLATATTLLFSSDYRYLGRVGSLASYRREALSQKSVAINAFKQLKELPWFLRNLLVKVALTVKFKPLARALGHRTDNWPY